MSTPSFAEVVAALARYGNRTSKAEANRILESVAGTTSLRQVSPNLFAEIIAALESNAPKGAELDPTAIFAKWNSQTRAPRDTDG